MRRALRFLVIALLLGLYGWGLGLLWFVSEIPREESDESQRADAAVVLTGGSLRLERGIDLLKNSVVKKLFISGVPRGVKVEEVLRAAGRSHPILPGSNVVIVLGYEASDTQGNAEETARWIAQENIASVRLVTANYHMKRAVAEFHSAVPGLVIIPDPVSPEHFKREEWWRFPGSLRLVISEYHKYLTRQLQYALHLERLRVMPKKER